MDGSGWMIGRLRNRTSLVSLVSATIERLQNHCHRRHDNYLPSEGESGKCYKTFQKFSEISINFEFDVAVFAVEFDFIYSFLFLGFCLLGFEWDGASISGGSPCIVCRSQFKCVGALELIAFCWKNSQIDGNNG